MGHDGSSDDANGDVEHSCMPETREEKSPPHLQEGRSCLRQDEDLDVVADADGGDEEQNNCLDGPHPGPLEGQQQQHIEPGDDDRPEERNVKHEVNRHRAAQHFGQVAGSDGDLAKKPVGPAGPTGIPVTAALGQILTGDHS